MKADLGSADGDGVKHPPKDAPRLVTAQDIARARIAAQGDSPDEDGAYKMLRWFRELWRAKGEKARGEWQLP